MKPTTLNFWIGVFVGAGLMKIGPSFCKGFKEGFIKTFKEVTDDHSKPIIDDRGTPYTDGTESDSSGLSESQMQEIYKKIAEQYTCSSDEIEDSNENTYTIDPGFLKTGKLDYSTIDQSILNIPSIYVNAKTDSNSQENE